MRAVVVVCSALFVAGCTCAQLDPGLQFPCDSGSQCADDERCVGGWCVADAGSAGGGSAGGRGGGGGTGGDGGSGGATGGGGGGGGAGGAGGGTLCDGGSGFDAPDDQFIDSNCDGIDGTEAGALFVDPVGGTPAGPGTKAQPFNSLEAALLAANSGHHSIYLASGAHRPSGTVLWNKAVSVYGGYAPANGWSRSSTRSLLEGKATALAVAPGPAGRVLDHVDVRSENALLNGQASIAVAVEGTTLELRHVMLTAGDGATGANGADGMNGAMGTAGGTGTPGPLLVDGGVLAAQGGVGGTSPCQAIGNNGGSGSVTLQPGGTGMPATAGGDSGDATASCASCPCTGMNFASPGNSAVGGGLDGGSGADGAMGAASLGTVSGRTWTPATGLSGQDGEDGTPGFGGGGGGAMVFGAGRVLGGSSGGGGGGAGCKGRGGLGGQGGGASIALLINAGRVIATDDVQLVTSQGGRGGNGGFGGAGGLGGPGGDGGPVRRAVCTTSGGFAMDVAGTPSNLEAGPGGNGARGGNGGSGGRGAGGPGGPIFGALCVNDAGIPAPRPSVSIAAPGAGGMPNGPSGVPVMLRDCTM